jgi:anti-sigma regulatory factor (Ser/Thr protein kinase)
MEVMEAHERVVVADQSQTSAARYVARDAAARAGFDDEDSYRAGLVATELATNLVKHATGGEILVRGLGDAQIEVVAIDRGPGMDDLARSQADGHSTAGTSGTGLGAARRLADDFDIHSQAGRGTVVLARLRAGRAPRPAAAAFDTAGISVAKSGEPVCGDSWQVLLRPEAILAIVADGLGHGVHAHEASRAAVASIDPRRDTNLVSLLQTMHNGLRHTRGAAVAVAEIGLRSQIVKYAGIGNISATIYTPAATRHAVSLNGTLGHEARAFREYSYPWHHDAVFVMFSDGLGTHWTLDAYRGLLQRHPAIVAAVLYRDFSRQRDDVTVVVGREAA